MVLTSLSFLFMPKITRGVRNNNPFNIRQSKNRWLGRVSRPEDSEFEQFTDIDYGIRAGLVLLRTYVLRHHLNTVRSIISRFAPPFENNTDAYISYCENVVRGYGYNPNDVKFANDSFCALCSAIMMYESIYYCSVDKVRSYLKKFGL